MPDSNFVMTSINNVWRHIPQVLDDSRGSFSESFRRDRTRLATGFDLQVQQMNTSKSRRGALRGIHFKKIPPGQAKFVSVSQGRILDLAIDLRKDSITFGHWETFELSVENNQSLLLGHGIGHAFLALEDDTRVSYLCDSVFEPELEFSINPLDSGINWQELANGFGITELFVSQRDSEAPGLGDAMHLLPNSTDV